MKIDRRKFLLGTSAVAVSAAIPVATPVTQAFEFNEITIGYAHLDRKTPWVGDILIANGSDAYGNPMKEVLGIWDGTRWLQAGNMMVNGGNNEPDRSDRRPHQKDDPQERSPTGKSLRPQALTPYSPGSSRCG